MTDRRRLIGIAMAAMLVMTMLGPLATIRESGAGGAGSSLRQAGYLLILMLSVYATWPTLTWSRAIAFSWPVLAAFVWCWLSLTWAVDPDVGARRAFLTTMVAWMAFTLVRAAGYRTSTDILRYVLLATIVASYATVLIDPVTGTHTVDDVGSTSTQVGNWRGLLGHKNFAGAVSALCVLMFVFDARHVRRAVRILAIVAGTYFLYRSQSKTSAGMLVMASLGGVIFETVNRRLRAYLIPILTLSVSLVTFVVSAYSDLFVSTVLNPTAFTGRGYIWSALLRYAADHPVFGAGFGSFWNIGEVSPVFQYGSGFVTQITVGHSGYIDQLVAVGVPGVTLMVVALAIWPLARLLMSAQAPRGRAALVAATLMFCIGHNVTESGLFERDTIVSTIFFFAAALAMLMTQGEHWGDRGASAKPTASAGDDLMRTMRRRRRAEKAAATGTIDGAMPESGAGSTPRPPA